MRAQGICPEKRLLKDLLDGALAKELERQLTDHLSTCDRCQQILESFAAWTTLTEVGRQLQQRGEAVRCPEGLKQAIQRLRHQTPAPETPEQYDWSEAMLLRSFDPPRIQGYIGRLGSYDLVEIIGRGGFGVVFKAFDPSLNRFVALKVLAPHLASNAAARKRFTREAKAAAAVRDEHVVAIYSVDEANGLPYLVMEYISGSSLQERLNRSGPLDVEEILRIGRQTAAGLAAAHAQGLIHRDIKPANILLENNVDRVKITDFGLARAADDASQTQSGLLAGTPQYMAPEQARGEPLDHRADLFSLGSVLYALCTGRPPFQAANTLGVLRRISEKNPPPIRQINPSIPAWLAKVVAILQAKNAAQRFSSAAEVADLFGQYLAYLQQPGTSPQPSLPKRRPVGPSRSILWLLAAVLLLGGLGLFALPSESKQRDPRYFYHYFRGRPLDTKSLAFTGPNARRQITEEGKGLKITLPAIKTKPQPTGLVANFHVSGDFEIITSYELLKADKPSDGSGVGVQLYLVMQSPTQEAVLLGRFNTPDQGDIYRCERLSTDEEGKRVCDHYFQAAPTRSGRLQLARKGSVVSCLVADSGREDFRPIHEFELGTADLSVVRVAADTGKTDNPVEVRLGHFAIHASGVSAEASGQAASWRRLVLYLTMASFALFLCAGGFWAWRRRPLRGKLDKAPTFFLLLSGYLFSLFFRLNSSIRSRITAS